MTAPKTSREPEISEKTLQLNEIRCEVLALATDHDVFWKVQREVIQNNVRLLTMRSAFFDMMNDAYVHATASRVRRLVDRDPRTNSLRRFLDMLATCPDLVSADELKKDLEELNVTCGKVKDFVNQFVAHHDRNRSSTVLTHRELNDAVETVIRIFEKYYQLINHSDIDMVVRYLEEPLSIFRFPWQSES
jgi:hypothetical protein